MIVKIYLKDCFDTATSMLKICPLHGRLRGRKICGMCGEKDPDHNEEDYLNEIKYLNCQQNYSVFPRSFDVYKKE